MFLSELAFDYGETIVRDGEFQNFGLLSYTESPGRMLSFFGNRSFQNHLENKKIACVICKKELVECLPPHVMGIIVSENPLLSFWNLHERYGNLGRFDFHSKYGENNSISNLASIDEYGVIIGNNVIIEEFVSIKAGTVIGDNVIIRTGSVIGGSCLELYRDKETIMVAPLYGGLKVDDNVYIGYNNTIVRGTFEWEKTHIGEGTKIDSNNVISHNVKIGENGVITSGIHISGDVVIGENVWISPGANITNSVALGDSVSIMFGARVMQNVGNNKAYVEGKIYDRRLLDAIKKKD